MMFATGNNRGSALRTGQPGIETTEDPLGAMLTWEGGCSYQGLVLSLPFLTVPT